MDIDAQLVAAAERLFDREGFNATGMGRVVAETGLSSRTVYKHARGKSALMAMVLAARRHRFFERVDFTAIDALFASLKDWAEREGARGCLFFRTQAETGGALSEIEPEVSAYHAQLQAHIAALIEREIGIADTALTEQMLVLFEGATTASSYRGTAAIDAAHVCARRLIEQRVAR